MPILRWSRFSASSMRVDVGLELLLVQPRRCRRCAAAARSWSRRASRRRTCVSLNALQEARVRHVRAAAHVHVFLVEVQAHRGDVGAHVVDQAQLVVLAAAREFLDDLLARRHLLDHVVVLRDQLAHALLDRGQVVRGERALVMDVVVEAFVDDRADHHLGVREQLLHRMADQVRAGVADDLHAFLVLRRDDAQAGVMVDDVAGIDQRPSTSPATVALARPAPIDCATCRTETGASNWRWRAIGKGDRDHVRDSGNEKRRRGAFG